MPSLTSVNYLKRLRHPTFSIHPSVFAIAAALLVVSSCRSEKECVSPAFREYPYGSSSFSLVVPKACTIIDAEKYIEGAIKIIPRFEFNFTGIELPPGAKFYTRVRGEACWQSPNKICNPDEDWKNHRKNNCSGPEGGKRAWGLWLSYLPYRTCILSDTGCFKPSFRTRNNEAFASIVAPSEEDGATAWSKVNPLRKTITFVIPEGAFPETCSPTKDVLRCSASEEPSPRGVPSRLLQYRDNDGMYEVDVGIRLKDLPQSHPWSRWNAAAHPKCEAI